MEYAEKGENVSIDPKRDVPLMQTIYQLGGIIHKRHVKELFWPDARTDRALEKRLNGKLSHNGYLLKTDPTDQEQHPKSEGVYCLGIKGAALVATTQGMHATEPVEVGIWDDVQHRKLVNHLKEQGFNWRRVPNWKWLAHDLQVIDIYVAMRRAIESQPGQLQLLQWVNEDYFRRQSNELQTLPDAYLKIADADRPGQAARFLIEMDRGNYENDRFIEKIKGEIEYLQSPTYKEFAEHLAGRWLVVFEKEGGMQNLIPKIAAAAGDLAYLFLMTSLDQLQQANALTAAIWHQPGDSPPRSLLDEKLT